MYVLMAYCLSPPARYVPLPAVCRCISNIENHAWRRMSAQHKKERKDPLLTPLWAGILIGYNKPVTVCE